ncbi:hypothetical protein [Phenylobacterium montanum]|uniref:Alpha/beta hydrolase n=1 Tax=Phenylobacterium montanum TaxID=2823693 RepID=A0A975G203_9CAUL|nr:hypothetical protein [Caulobacter sp. S6]QUD89256.1 hypothetical protein KCG34_05085 [Caulobacter sp. S6]
MRGRGQGPAKTRLAKGCPSGHRHSAELPGCEAVLSDEPNGARYDARALGETFKEPVFVINGADDNVTPVALAERYV